MCEITATVIGGGIVGCAVAAGLSGQGVATVLLEKDDAVARGTTSRNSEVVHGGMYYPAGSMKARYCVQGRRMLKEFCTATGVQYRECGKLIVAIADQEIPELERLLELGLLNGVEDLRLVDGAELLRLEPEIRAKAGLYSPRTAILDAEGATRAYADQARSQGAQIMISAPVTGLERGRDCWKVQVTPAGDGRREGWSHSSRLVINAAGLFSDRMAALAGVGIAARGWKLVHSKGNYFRIDPRHAGRVERLIYPVPPADGSSLGVHVCLDLNGQLRLGPDFESVIGVSGQEMDPADPLAELWDYRVDPSRGAEFFRDATGFLPWLKPEDLGPDQCGIRPKLALSGFRDFVVCREGGDLTGLINLIGIDSPGLTCAPALAREVVRLAMELLDE
ncbi:MAG: NAD(P)/FAD-dependent oxidoreductase [Gemmatimonadales bacterium]|nr:NAD(P)/FAD-dependent oxidoreductase [Gemmatimonadales bacterium]